ncbi:winged helix DNA-binding domain-containing protein [Streptomyces sp. cmx-18-6]|uniref:winged helix DNA-binding domain-containing protein n=1 Tax=Streptomyces sp. cmx-18-6 TaxID=2790930 RepID=UPI003980FA3A
MLRQLGPRALNRTYLERQFLLRRSPATSLEAVGHLVCLQGQESNSPYLSLWSRLARFAHGDLTTLLQDRLVVRSKLHRNTQHLILADDFRTVRPLLEPVLKRARQGAFGRAIAGLDLADLAGAGRELMSGQGVTRPQLGRRLCERFPGRDRQALTYAVQSLVAHVHPPPSGTWGDRTATPLVLAEEWIGGPLEAEPRIEDVVVRYLAAHGPASVMDVQAWSGLTRLRPVLDGMRARLRTYRDTSGRELFDLPDAPIAEPDGPAPVRFLPAFDNLILSHADRTRVIADEDRQRVITGSEVRPVFLVDGFVRGIWSLRADGGVQVTPYRPLTSREADETRQEAELLLDFLAEPVTGRVVEGAAEPRPPVVIE